MQKRAMIVNLKNIYKYHDKVNCKTQKTTRQ